MVMKRKILFIRKLAYYLRIYGVREVYRIMTARKNKPYNFDDYKWFQKKHRLKSSDAMFQRAFRSEKNFLICVIDADSEQEIEASKLKKSLAKSTYERFDFVAWPKLGAAVDVKIAHSAADGENSHSAIDGEAEHTHVIFAKKDDAFSQDALYEYANALDRDKYIDLIYCDSDHYDSQKKGLRFDPYFKPAFSPDYLEEFNYIRMGYAVEMGVVRKAFSRGVERNELDLIISMTDAADSIELPGGGSKNIAHLSKMLYHEDVRITDDGMKDGKVHTDLIRYEQRASEKLDESAECDIRALEKHYQRLDEPGKVTRGKVAGTYHFVHDIEEEPLVSIIVPNMDHLEDLKTCIESFDKSTYTNIEWIIVENNSRDSKLFDYYSKINKRDDVRVIEYHDDFNFSQICNRGVEESEGDLLLFLNNDTELLDPNSLTEMVTTLMREGVGIVGARLLYDDNTVQHAGVTLGVGGFACHSNAYIEEDDPGYMNRSLVMTDVSAVTAACLLIDRDMFFDIGGFDESYQVAANDVDLCMKVLHEGLKVVYNPHSIFHHYESKSRGDDRAQMKKAKRLQSEVDRFAKRWKDILVNGDPYYNSNFSRGFEYKVKLRKQKWHRAFFYRR